MAKTYVQEAIQEGEAFHSPIKAKVSGSVPDWVFGTFIRIGPGKLQWEKKSYKHWFEGDAILHRFEIANGQVMFSAKFLQSKSHLESQRTRTITSTGFATRGAPDPCKNIFQRFMSYFFMPFKHRDNCNVNTVTIKDRVYATGDDTKLWEFDTKTLDCRESIDIASALPGMRSWTSHPHFEKNGDYFNCSAAYDKNEIEFVRIPAAASFGDDPLHGIEVVASFPAGSKQTYFHSFGMTEHYFIFTEGSLLVKHYFHSKVLNEAAKKLLNKTNREMLVFDPKTRSRFHLIERSSGKMVASYEADPFFSFHQVNAYETKEEIVFDITVYPDDSVIDNLYLSNMRNGMTTEIFPAELRRYRLPLNVATATNPPTVHLPRGLDGLDHELIHQSVELPAINYDNFNGVKYRFAYGVGNSSIRHGLTTILKIDVETKQAYEWQEENCYPSEPAFVPSPDAEEEDDGVIVSAVLGLCNQSSFLLFLDGKTMTEVARAYVPANLIPLFHSHYFSS